MRYIGQQLGGVLIGALVLASTTTALPAADDDYKEFRKCVGRTGVGTQCVTHLPENSDFRGVLDNSKNIADRTPNYVPPSSWLPGGLNTRSAASILLQMQQVQTPPR